jgi:hypothetical protein
VNPFGVHDSTKAAAELLSHSVRTACGQCFDFVIFCQEICKNGDLKMTFSAESSKEDYKESLQENS